jgi:N-methylhydantoinase A/oxoprolinase/acetone carboxylase beta subunit
LIIGLDTGGTHVDAVLIENGKIIDKTKKPTDKSNLFESIWKTLEELLKNKNLDCIEKINLSTTIPTNAIVEGKGSKVAMFIEGGPGIDPANFICGDHVFFLDGYIDHRGREIKPLNEDLVRKKTEYISSKDIKSFAVVTKFSIRNPSHELQVKDVLTKLGFSPVTMGHTLSGKLSFPRRIYTAYLNSAIFSSFNEFAHAVRKTLKQKGLNVPIHILKADGGTMSLNEASKYPVQTIFSGPAASVMGCLASFNLQKDALLLDIGGTTTDISFLADGVPLFIPDGIAISDYPTLVRSIINISIGLGGDSAIKINERGNIIIGPERQGPPMALDGPTPTPSDAMIVLEKLNFGSKEKASYAMSLIADKIGVTIEKAAEKIYDKFGEIIKEKTNEILHKINSHPVYTIQELLYGKRIKPENIVVIGGPAKAVAPILEKKFNIPCKIPQNHEITNAIGAALTRRTLEVTLLADTERKILSVPEMGIYKKVDSSYNLDSAKRDAIKLLHQQLKNLDADSYLNEVEIIEENSFNMVRGFFTSGKNIRLRAQIKPGLIYRIGDDKDA